MYSCRAPRARPRVNHGAMHLAAELLGGRDFDRSRERKNTNLKALDLCKYSFLCGASPLASAAAEARRAATGSDGA